MIVDFYKRKISNFITRNNSLKLINNQTVVKTKIVSFDFFQRKFAQSLDLNFLFIFVGYSYSPLVRKDKIDDSVS